MHSTDDKTFILEEKEGFSPAIGRLVAMMEYARNTTLEAVNELTVEELDYRIDGNGNSIACLLQHVISVEKVYQILTFEERNPTEEELEQIEVGLMLGEKAHRDIRGNKVEYYLEQLQKTRRQTLEELKKKEDSWLEELFPFGPNHKTNNYFRWFHVFEDELNHRGQIRLIHQHWKRGKEEI
jgi:uncharacterized damage-inducible protein DinB